MRLKPNLSNELKVNAVNPIQIQTSEDFLFLKMKVSKT
jgi:hypothetical protein